MLLKYIEMYCTRFGDVQKIPHASHHRVSAGNNLYHLVPQQILSCLVCKAGERMCVNMIPCVLISQKKQGEGEPGGRRLVLLMAGH